MPTVNDLKSSKFLTKHDVEPAVVVTIQSYEEVNVALESQAEELKWTLSFKELDKPLVLNLTNGQLIEMITGTEDFEGWIGQKVELYNDKTVSFAGKITGGIRIREAGQSRTNAVKAAADAARQAAGNRFDGSEPTPADDVPF